jgi:periplasmic protein CpxP/Spy
VGYPLNQEDFDMRNSDVNVLPAQPSLLLRMRWALGGLAVIGGLMAATATFDARAEHQQEAQERHHGGAGMMMGLPMQGHRMDRMYKRLNVSDAQKTQLQALAKSQQADMMQARQTHQALHQEMLNLLKQPTMDDASVQTWRTKVLAHHQEMMAKRLQAGVDMARVLTAPQRQQLAELLGKRMAGKGKHHGHHRMEVGEMHDDDKSSK